jgi:hypothetical protein
MHNNKVPISALFMTSALLVAWLSLAGGCSLGEGVTPTCDINAAPNTDNACNQVAECDQGNGVVVATDPCCDRAASQDLAICEQVEVEKLGGSFIQLCVGNPMASGCCTSAQKTFDICKAGTLSSGSGGGGVGGSAGGAGGAAGGMGGAGGAGGMAGAGGMGGAGGN